MPYDVVASNYFFLLLLFVYEKITYKTKATDSVKICYHQRFCPSANEQDSFNDEKLLLYQ